MKSHDKMVLYISGKEIASILSLKQALKEIKNVLFEWGNYFI